MKRIAVHLAALCALPLLVACASGAPSNPSTVAATNGIVSVERFLQAASVQDLDAMAQIFGTRDGPIAAETGSTLGCAFQRMGSWLRLSSRCRSWSDIDLQMNALAQVLRHENFDIRSESNVPGRANPAIRVGVDLTQDGEVYTDVPFVVVQARSGRWHIEEIGLSRVTGG
jgi:hypothetical protein